MPLYIIGCGSFSSMLRFKASFAIRNVSNAASFSMAKHHSPAYETKDNCSVFNILYLSSAVIKSSGISCAQSIFFFDKRFVKPAADKKIIVFFKAVIYLP